MSSLSPANDDSDAVSGEENDDEEKYEWCPICRRFGRQPCVPCSSMEQQDDYTDDVNRNEMNDDIVWEEEFSFQRCESSTTKCRGCDDNIAKGYLRVRHLRQKQHGSSYQNKAFYYHLPCWHSSEHKPAEAQRPLSKYYLFDALPQSLQDQILDSHQGTSKSIRFHDPSLSTKAISSTKKSKKGKMKEDKKKKKKNDPVQRKRKKTDDFALDKTTASSSLSPKKRKVIYDV